MSRGCHERKKKKACEIFGATSRSSQYDRSSSTSTTHSFTIYDCIYSFYVYIEKESVCQMKVKRGSTWEIDRKNSHVSTCAFLFSFPFLRGFSGSPPITLSPMHLTQVNPLLLLLRFYSHAPPLSGSFPFSSLLLSYHNVIITIKY